MKIFPIDPTPFMYIFAVVVFLLPWLIYMYHIFQHTKKSGIKFIEEGFWVSWKVPLTKSNKKWFLITLICWVLGFALLGLTLYFLDQNNLLINHSKGIY